MKITNEWYLVCMLLGLGILGCMVLLYPLRRQKRLCLGLFSVILPALAVAYYHWGGFVPWRQHLYQQRSMDLVQNTLKSIKKPQDLIDRLRAKVEAEPQNAQGWYLLGRLYNSQNDVNNAYKVLVRTYQLAPDKVEYAVEYAHAAWQMNNQEFTKDIREMLQSILDKHPDQPDALSMLAMDAYLEKDYDKAIHHWQALLNMVPQNSDEAHALGKAIAMAYKKKMP